MPSFVRIGIGTLAAALAVPGLALASTTTRASCQIRVPIALSRPLNGTRQSGSLQSTRLGTIDCAGEIDGVVSDGRGWITATGTYANGEYNPYGNPLGGFDTCALGTAQVSFFGEAPVFLSNRRPIRLDGTVRLAPLARALQAAGNGRAGRTSPSSFGSTAVSYSGLGAFTADRGQNCTSVPIRSGVLAETLVILGGR